MKILGNRILVEPVEEPISAVVETDPRSQKESPIGIIVEVGDGKEIDPLLTVGARVWLNLDYGFVAHVQNGKRLRLHSAKDALLVFRPTIEDMERQAEHILAAPNLSEERAKNGYCQFGLPA